MPPWSATADGSCGEFVDADVLSDEEIALIAAWAEAGALEGDPQTIQVPDVPELDDATELETPKCVPEVQGGPLALYDEYRCFVLDVPEGTDGYITAYDVIPGNDAIVHHVAAFVIDPTASAETEDGRPSALSNREQMARLADDSPDREPV